MVKRLYRDEVWLRDKYEILGWSQSEIAAHCDVSQSVIWKWMKRHGINSRSISESNSGKRNGAWLDSPYKDYHYLYREYITNRRSIRDIAKSTNFSIRTIARWLDNHEIETRQDGESFTNLKYSEDHHSYTGATVCPICSLEKSSAAEKCRECHFDFIRANPEENSNYKGIYEISAQLRSLTKDWRAKIFVRDNYKCVECDATGRENLNAHHIIPFSVIRDQMILEYGAEIQYDFSTEEDRIKFISHCKNDSRIQDLDNGITLCKECHLAQHRRVSFNKSEMVYVYYGTVVGNYDGDTMTLDIDLGFGLTKRTKVRLFGVNTRELRGTSGEEKIEAIAGKNLISSICVPGRKITVRIYKPGKYGRWLGIVMLDFTDLNNSLLEVKLADEYYGA